MDYRFFLMVLCLTASICAMTNNKLVGNPHVVCNEEGVIFEMETEQPFTGQLYVRNEFHNEKCRANFESASGRPYLKGGSFKLKFNDCGMRRQRVVTPLKGMAYTVTMIAQFHKTFVTDSDKAYHVRCFYREQTIAVTAGEMDVSPLATDMMHIDHPMPKCTYSIRHNGVNGPMATFARIGDPVVHSFYCENDYDTYALLVRECFVDDGKEHVQKLIGADGCSVDEKIFQTPKYSVSQLEASAEAKVFKWPDETSVYFSCQITLCMKDDTDCQLKTPPRCGLARHRFKRSTNETVEPTVRNHENKGINFDLEIRRLIVLDFEDGVDSSVYSQMASSTGKRSRLVSLTNQGNATNLSFNTSLQIEPPLTTTTSNSTTTEATTITTSPLTTTSTSTTTTPVFTTTSTSPIQSGTETLSTSPLTPMPTSTISTTLPSPILTTIVQPVATESPIEDKTISHAWRTNNSAPEPYLTEKISTRQCFGPEYVIGFGIMLTLFCLILGLITVRLCYPYINEKLRWRKERSKTPSSSAESFTNPNTTVGLVVPQMCGQYSFYPY